MKEEKNTEAASEKEEGTGDSGDEIGKLRKRIKFWRRLSIAALLAVAFFLILKVLVSGAHGTLDTHWDGKRNEEGTVVSFPKDKNAKPSITRAVEENKLRVIEFCESGQFWSSNVKKAAVNFVDRAEDGSNVYVFVHGWNHNGDPTRESGDLNRFSKFLLKLNEEDKSGKSHVGVYIAWPGDARRWSNVSRVLSFPGKRSATRRVASPNLADVLYQIRKRANKEDKAIILIGHSFGGRVVERLVSPSIQSFYNYRWSQTTIGKVDREEALAARRDLLLADLTIIINPASEGLHCRMLKLATQRWPYGEMPALVSLTSETDKRTSETWRLGKTFERAIVPTVVQDERILTLANIENESVLTYLNRTAGHDRRLLSVEIVKGESEERPFRFRKELAPPKGFENLLFPTLSEEKCKGGKEEDKKLYGSEGNEHILPSGGYFAARVDQGILDGHNGSGPKNKNSKGRKEDEEEDLDNTIFNSEMRKLISYLVSGLDKDSDSVKQIAQYRKEIDFVPGGYGEAYKIPHSWIEKKKAATEDRTGKATRGSANRAEETPIAE